MNNNNSQFNGAAQQAQGQGYYPPQGEQGYYSPQGNPGQEYYPPQGTPGQGYYPPPNYAQPHHFAQKPVFPTDKKDRAFAPILLILCGVGVFAGLWGGFQAGFTVSFDLLFIALTVYFAKKGTAPNLFALICGMLSLALSGVFTATTNELVRFFSVIALVCTSIVWFSALAGKRLTGGELSLIRHIALPIGEMFGEMPRMIRTASSVKTGERRSVPKALLGVICALPLLCAVVALLIRSDAAFEGMVGSIFKSIGSVIVRIVLTLIITPFLLSFAFSLRKKTRAEKAERELKGLDTSFLAAFTGVLSVCYLVYLFSQLAYFVSAFSGFLPVGYSFSYSEYARRGFFELCVIAGINLAVLYLTILLARKKDGKLPGALRTIGAFIGCFTLFLIATAVSKNIMYIRNSGMTVLRVGSSAFLCALAVVFLAAILRCFFARVRILPVALVAFACTLCVLGIGNINAACAKYNYDTYRSGQLKKIDCEHLSSLGAEGVPYLVDLAMHGTEDDAAAARTELYYLIPELYDGEWKSETEQFDEYYTEYLEPQRHKYPALSQYSIPRAKAYAAIDALLKEEPEFMHVEAQKF